MRKSVFQKVSLLLSCLFNPAIVLADSVCTERPLTAEEKRFYSQFSTLRDSLPKPATGWRYREGTQAMMAPSYTGIPAKTCKESHGPKLQKIFYYERVRTAKDEAMMQRAHKQAPDRSKMGDIEKITQRITKLTEQVVAAANKGDMATVERLNEEINTLSLQAQGTVDKMYAPQAATLAEIERDSEASVSIEVNASGTHCNGRPQSETVKGVLVYRCAHDKGYSSSGGVLDKESARVVLVFGKAQVKTQEWTRLDSTQREFNDRMVTITTDYNNKQPMVVHNVVVVIESDNPARVEQLYKAMPTHKLTALVSSKK